MNSKFLLILTSMIALAAMPLTAQNVAVDDDIKTYSKVSGVSGNLNSIGSDTLNNLMTLWAEGFQAIYPNVRIQIEGKGSSTAPPSLIEGTAQLGPMSREMKAAELDAFEKKFGYKPTAIRVAIDALAVFVHKDNPIEGLNLQQVDAIFSSTLKRGGKAAATWGDLGLTGAWKNQPLSAYGRNSASGTYGFFKSLLLNKGDYRPTVKEQPGSSAVVQGIAKELGGIGYSGIGYATSGVRTLPIAEEGDDFYEPSYENCLEGDYPIARFLYVYVNKKPNQPLDKLTQEFLRFVLAKQGQEVVVKDGYYPLPAEVAEETAEALK
ncbi:MAG: phosphate transport system substrate-binding protein [Rhodothermales bacterium]|jgi:phosphate transport system substrate-binding protein